MSNAVQIGINLIKQWEKCRLVAYPDPISGGDPWTVGWGATGPNIRKGTVWTQAEADADLINRVNVLVSQIRTAVKVVATDNQIGAFIDFAYNEGFPALLKSTLLRDFNAGDTAGASKQFLVWDMADGHEVQGLENRREAEQRVFNT